MKALFFVGFVLFVQGCTSLGEKKEGSLPLDFSKTPGPGEEGFKDFLLTDLFIKANDASLRGEYDRALSLLEKIHSLEGENPHIKKKLAYAAIRAGQWQRAEGPLKELLESSGYREEKIILALGGLYTATGQRKKAQGVYVRGMEKVGSADICLSLANLYGVTGRETRADKLLGRCGKKFKSKGVFPYTRGKLALQVGAKKRALAYFRQSLKRQKDYHPAVLGVGIIQETQKKPRLALEEYKKFLAHSPDSLPVLSRAVDLFFSEQLYEEGLPYAEALSGLDPSNLSLKVKLALHHGEAQRYRQAIGILEEVRIGAPDSEKVIYYLGQIHGSMGQMDKALSYFQQIEAFLPAQVQRARILAHRALEKESQTKNLVDFVGAYGEKHPKIRVDLGMILASFYEEKDDIPRAIEVLTPLKGESTFDDGHAYYLASLLEKNGDFDSSREIIRGIIAKNPNSPEALNFLGYSLLEQGLEMDKAYNHITKALALKPDDGHILDSLGWYYFKTGRYQEALVTLKKAQGILKEDATVNSHLASAYGKLRSYGMAKLFFVEALKHCKRPAEKKQILRSMEGLGLSPSSTRLPASVP